MTREYTKTQLEEILTQSNKPLIELKEKAERKQKEEDLKSGLKEIGLANDECLITKEDAFEVMKERYDLPDDVTDKDLETIMETSQKELEESKLQFTNKEFIYQLLKECGKGVFNIGVKSLYPVLGSFSYETRSDIENKLGKEYFNKDDSVKWSKLIDVPINTITLSAIFGLSSFGIGYGLSETVMYFTSNPDPFYANTIKGMSTVGGTLVGAFVGFGATVLDTTRKNEDDKGGNLLNWLIEKPLKLTYSIFEKPYTGVKNIYSNTVNNLKEKKQKQLDYNE